MSSNGMDLNVCMYFALFARSPVLGMLGDAAIVRERERERDDPVVNLIEKDARYIFLISNSNVF